MTPLALPMAILLAMPNVPGAVNPAVTQDNIGTTICKSGWTKTVRPPASYTDKIKKRLMVERKLPGKPSDYELDHKLSIEDGGDPTSLLNLWMQPYAGPHGARVKDRIETKLKTLTCSGKITLADAQHYLLNDWTEGYRKYIGPLP